jgi:D-3-phosphoglycerate dehydrogenase
MAIMAEWKILIADKIEESGVAILRSNEHTDDCAGISPKDLSQIIGAYHALIVRSRTKVTAELIEAAPSLCVIGRAGVGVDNIDLDAAYKNGIVVVNTPTATSNAVAELTIAMLLSLARNITRADATMKKGHWAKKTLVGSELFGKTLGLIGVGNIGSLVSERSCALGMKVLGHDNNLPDKAIAQCAAQPVTLPELYASADYISLHVPLNAGSKDMINSWALSQMKRGVRLICTARGGIINENALYAALESGQVSGAALDVYSKEPPGLSPLIQHPRVIATPHIGAQTHEAQARAAQEIANEVLAALRGEQLHWRVI